MLNNMSNNKKKIILPIVFVLLLVIATVGITYAFFNYTRTGSANTLNTGRIYFSTEQTNQNTITLNNIFPMTKEQALADSSTNGTLVVTFNGDTEYTDGMEYLLSIDSVTGATNVPISLIMDVNITENSVALTENANYYTAREAKNASMYKAEGENVTINSTTHKVITDIETGKYLLAGYIKSGEYGVNGTVTIKAFIDADNILITDTPDDQSQRPSTAYTDGTDTTGKTIISTTDWNNLQSTGISFRVKGEAKPGIWVENPNKPTLYDIMKNASQGTLTDFSKTSEQDETSGVYETTEGATPIYYYRGAVDNNVKFGDYCWKAVRTTTTGGVKLIYNGKADIEGSGDNISYNCEISRDIQDTVKSTINLFTGSYDTPYFYADDYEIVSIEENKVTYRLKSKTNPITQVAISNETGAATNIPIIVANYPYTCMNSNETATCTTLFKIDSYASGTEANVYSSDYRSIIGKSSYNIYSPDTKYIGYTYDDNGVNTPSNMKQVIDTWYTAAVNNSKIDDNKLEYTTYCNDRSFVGDDEWGTYGANLRLESANPTPSVDCPNSADNYNLKAGFITADEVAFAGLKYGDVGTTYLNDGGNFWTGSPAVHDHSSTIYIFGLSLEYDGVSLNYGVRPVVSLIPGTIVTGGEGTPTDPFIIG